MSATVRVTWNCSGCDEKVEADRQLLIRRFRSFSGRDHGVGVWHWPAPEIGETYPPEWTKDPYTGADYCPSCAATIWPDELVALRGEDR